MGNVKFCPACWGHATLKMDKHGRPYVRCGSGCRVFTTTADSIAALTVVSEWIDSALERMERDVAYREAMRGVVVASRRSLRAALALPSPAPSVAEPRKEVA